VLNSSAGSHFPDHAIRRDLKVIEEQLSLHVDSALHMDKLALKAKPEIERTLMESLALKETNEKVRICCSIPITLIL
jgi:hypothetical protein